MAKNPEPQTRLTNRKIETFFGLDPAEMVAMGLFNILCPLIAMGTDLPLLLKAVSAASWFGWGLLLFVYRRNELSAATWLTRMIPFWLRQRRFRAVASNARVTPQLDAAGPSLALGANAISFAWREGIDGVRELHIYEDPTRPFRAWIGAAERRPFQMVDFEVPAEASHA